MAKFMVLIATVVLAFLVAVPMPEVTAKKYLVGEKQFWNPNVNYAAWVKGKHFYIGDWLYFVMYREKHNILEVSKADYDKCNGLHPIKNYTRGAGRDIVPLFQTRVYYLIDGRGGCSQGMKLSVRVLGPPPPSPPPPPPRLTFAPTKTIG